MGRFGPSPLLVIKGYVCSLKNSPLLLFVFLWYRIPRQPVALWERECAFVLGLDWFPLLFKKKVWPFQLELSHDPMISFHFNHYYLQSFVEISRSAPCQTEQLQAKRSVSEINHYSSSVNALFTVCKADTHLLLPRSHCTRGKQLLKWQTGWPQSSFLSLMYTNMNISLKKIQKYPDKLTAAIPFPGHWSIYLRDFIKLPYPCLHLEIFLLPRGLGHNGNVAKIALSLRQVRQTALRNALSCCEWIGTGWPQ